MLWLNLGNGDYYAEDWINVDSRRSPYPADQYVDLTGNLPWEPDTITRVYAGHLLEHLTIADGIDLLRKLRKLARSGCELMIVGPDVLRAEAMNLTGELSDEWVRLVKEGGHRWPGDEHQWECEPGTLIRMCVEAEWSNISEIPIYAVPDIWPLVSRVEWQCAVRAMA